MYLNLIFTLVIFLLLLHPFLSLLCFPMMALFLVYQLNDDFNCFLLPANLFLFFIYVLFGVLFV